MTLKVSTRDHAGTTVLSLAGTADEAVLVEVVDGIEAVALESGHLVVHVDDFWLVDVTAIRAFLVRLLESRAATRVAFACGRLSGRQILRRWGTSDLRVFRSVAEAAAAGSGAALELATGP